MPLPLPCRFFSPSSLFSFKPHLSVTSNLPLDRDRDGDGEAFKAPTAPWMKAPLLLPRHRVLDLHKTPPTNTNTSPVEIHKADRALSGKSAVVRGNKSVRKIVLSIRRLQQQRTQPPPGSEESVEFRFDRAEAEAAPAKSRQLPWAADEIDRAVFRRTKKEKAVTAAELALDKELLNRLRADANKLRKWVKVMKIGVSREVVDEINRIWRRNELIMLKFHVPLSRNMDRAQQIVEEKTGGLVVWRRKDSLVIYRGVRPRSERSLETVVGQVNFGNADMHEEGFRGVTGRGADSLLMCDWIPPESLDKSLFERETDRLLDNLGPRYEDWWMRKPLPVDADLLPEVVPGFRPPQRMCPPNERLKLTDDELTYLRKLALPLPTHFVLGRNRGLQGLAAAILSLWDKSLIAKIAVKWGVPNTNNETMANELKHLTGGVLLLRNKFYIILFRGKDFLPGGVASWVTERELELQRCLHYEEDTRWKTSKVIPQADEPLQTSTIGTLSDFQIIQTEHWDPGVDNRRGNIPVEAERHRLRKELRKQERRLFILKSKMNISEKRLLKLNKGRRPTEWDHDQEIMTEEERECFRKMGLKMDDYLLLGRRGVFDGVIEALHQHWKHREVVKVITKQRMYTQVVDTANLLEAESGGILVSVDEQKEGHAIIVYRGRNYRRPSKLSTEHLLTKRTAFLRSLEMQRLGSLKFFARCKEREISDLKLKLAKLENHLVEDSTLHRP